MGKIQNKTGRDFENEFAVILKTNGFWVKLLATGTGQPCDIVAVRNNCAYFFECKTTDTDVFSFKGLRPNQRTAYEYITSHGNNLYFVAIKFPQGINVVGMSEILCMEKNGVNGIGFRNNLILKSKEMR